MYWDKDITNEQIQEMGWEGISESLHEASELATAALEAVMDDLASFMTKLVLECKLSDVEIVELARRQSEVFQSLEIWARTTQHTQNVDGIWQLVRKWKSQAAAEEA